MLNFSSKGYRVKLTGIYRRNRFLIAEPLALHWLPPALHRLFFKLAMRAFECPECPLAHYDELCGENTPRYLHQLRKTIGKPLADDLKGIEGRFVSFGIPPSYVAMDILKLNKTLDPDLRELLFKDVGDYASNQRD